MDVANTTTTTASSAVFMLSAPVFAVWMSNTPSITNLS
jgi:hypothetical protein